MREMLPLLETVIGEVRAGRPAALCAVVGTKGSVPQVPGSCMVLRSDGQTEGTVGGGYVEAQVCRRASALLKQGNSELLRFTLDESCGGDEGAICGGSMDVAVQSVNDATRLEPIECAVQELRENRTAQLALRVEVDEGLAEYRLNMEPEAHLIIAGGGHVGLALANLCRGLEFRITVVDDREQFANQQRFGADVDCRVGPFKEVLAELDPGPNGYVVIVTRGHKNDEESLRAVIGSRAKYIGMIGSRRKIKHVFENLRAEGVSEAQLQRVHAPVGLDINAITVNEIAVSIGAELIQVRRADRRQIVEGPLPVATEA
jgi:xanthine dehydrogenase accessory factor